MPRSRLPPVPANPQLAQLLAQLLGYQSPLTQAMPEAPAGMGGSHVGQTGGGPGVGGTAGGHGQTGADGQHFEDGGQQFTQDNGHHRLRARHALLLNLLLHGKHPISARQHATLRALRNDTEIPGRADRRDQQFQDAPAQSFQAAGPSRRRARTFGPR